jgi:hypothetical protein
LVFAEELDGNAKNGLVNIFTSEISAFQLTRIATSPFAVVSEAETIRAFPVIT